MAKQVFWVSFGPSRIAYSGLYYAARTAIVMANEHGYARIDWKYWDGFNGWVNLVWEYWRVP